MYGKFIFVAVLIAFLYVQIGASLECHSCTTPTECRNPGKVVCSSATANNTHVHLNKFFQNVQTAYKDNYNCLFQNYTQNNQLNMTYKGCVYRDSNACSLTLHANASSLSQVRCVNCSGNLCNSAGSFSVSAFTVLATVMTAFMAKSFAA